MNKIFVVCCREWGGSSYSFQVIEAYTSENEAVEACSKMQWKHKQPDICYFYEVIDLIGDS